MLRYPLNIRVSPSQKGRRILARNSTEKNYAVVSRRTTVEGSNRVLDSTLEEDISDTVAPVTMPQPLEVQQPAQQWLRYAAIGGIGSAAIFAVVLLKSFDISINDLEKVVEGIIAGSGSAGPAVFVAIYSLCAVLLLPGALMTLVAGYMFGPVQGTINVIAASNLAATTSFLLARYLARPLVESRLDEYPKFAAIDKAIAKEGAKIVLLLRLSPLIPFGPLNYFLGVTKIPLAQSMAATALGMLPGTFAYVYLGGVGRETVEAAGGVGGMGAGKLALYAIGAVATVLATSLISKQATKALEEADEEQ